MKYLDNDLFQLTFKKSGCKDLVIVVELVKGDRTEVNVVMENFI